ncbi:MAG: hypothetical protein SWH78_08165 [Thermodesulfobacteriota bacterium]|nr:hypothetical protein [Thermodesulfobacteriota bacterium]
MSEYNQEQLEAIVTVRRHLEMLSPSELKDLKARIESYLGFRRDVDRFMEHYFSAVCTQMCYQDRYSACCNREGIITFFVDVVINLLMSEEEDVDRLLGVLREPKAGAKCVYLGKAGCLWRLKPIVCQMFLCERARKTVFSDAPDALKAWEELKQREKRYTWPDRAVLFDELEAYFMARGCFSSLMYCHTSPGLLRVKALAQRGGKTAKAPRLRDETAWKSER